LRSETPGNQFSCHETLPKEWGEQTNEKAA